MVDPSCDDRFTRDGHAGHDDRCRVIALDPGQPARREPERSGMGHRRVHGGACIIHGAGWSPRRSLRKTQDVLHRRPRLRSVVISLRTRMEWIITDHLQGDSRSFRRDHATGFECDRHRIVRTAGPGEGDGGLCGNPASLSDRGSGAGWRDHRICFLALLLSDQCPHRGDRRDRGTRPETQEPDESKRGFRLVGCDPAWNGSSEPHHSNPAIECMGLAVAVDDWCDRSGTVDPGRFRVAGTQGG